MKYYTFFVTTLFFLLIICFSSCQQHDKEQIDKATLNKKEDREVFIQQKLGRFNTVSISTLKTRATKTTKERLINFGDLFVEIGSFERGAICFKEALKRDLQPVELSHTKEELKKCQQYLKRNVKVLENVEVPTLTWWDSLPIEWQELLTETAIPSNPTQADIDKLFYEVTYLNFKNTAIASLEPIALLVNLTSINADNSTLVSLYGAAKLKKLQSIRATQTKIVSLSGVEKLQNLRELRCAYNNISSLNSLKNLPVLTHLDIRGTKVTSLKPVSQLSSLEQLLFSGLPITTLEDIKSLTGLETIFCDQTRIDTIGELSRMKALKSLNITKTNIRSLAPLDKLDKLEKLYCMNTPLSKKEIRRFKKLHPKCQVYSNFDKPK